MSTGEGIRLPDFPAATGFTDTDFVFMTQGGATVKGTVAQLKDAVAINGSNETFVPGDGIAPGTFLPGAASVTLVGDYGSINNIDVYADATPQLDSTLTGHVLGFPNGGVPLGISKLVIKGKQARPIGAPSDATVTDSKLAPGSKIYNRANDSLSITDIGAGSTADFQKAINDTPSGGTIVLPKTTNYNPTFPSLNFGGKAIRFDATSGAKINGGEGSLSSGPAILAEYSLVNNGNGFDYRAMKVWDQLDSANGAGGYSNAFSVIQNFGGPNCTGGHAAINCYTILSIATSPTNTNRNYQAGAFNGIASVSDGGTLGAPKGQVFGSGSIGILQAGATGFLNVSACEFDTSVQEGASVVYKSGIQIAGMADDAVQGATFDGAVCISNATGAVGWKNGVLFTLANGQHPVHPTGALIATQGAYTVSRGIDFSSYTFSGAAILTNNFALDGAGNISMPGANAFVALGAVGAANQPKLVFYTGAGAPAYDGELLWSGGDGSNGSASLQVGASSINLPSASAFLAIAGQRVVGAQIAGYGAPTGAAKLSNFPGATATLAQTSAMVAQIIADLRTHGLLGA
ncbi:hypothetical protein B0G84_4969 [Paraburkholderia sp. BL8N3]|nr:hypothetical protein [Paraburkholderia sp. BL8N3]TCK39629.1 hypothetical protein B0G84_4969 [Paraburkholderia sp. BL8N3]